MNARASISHEFRLQDFKLWNCSAEGRGSRRASTKNRPATCGPVQIFALTTADGANAGACHGGANDDGASALRSCPASHPPGSQRQWRDWPTIAPGRARPARPGSAPRRLQRVPAHRGADRKLEGVTSIERDYLRHAHECAARYRGSASITTFRAISKPAPAATDRRRAKAVRHSWRSSRAARCNSYGARSRCRSAGIPAHRSRCTPARHRGRGNTAGKRRRARPGNGDRCESAAAAFEPGAASRTRLWAMPVQSAAAQSAPSRRLQAVQIHLQKPPIRPLSRSAC